MKTKNQFRLFLLLALSSQLIPGLSLAEATTAEELVVTASGQPRDPLDLVGNISLVDEGKLRTTNAVHMQEIGVQIPGVWVSRGSGQEHLTAVRSPVLTGPGSCGAFLILEDSIPTRPTGFCNVNQLFEVPTEQARGIETIRGPANALYGSNGLHGTINTLLPEPGQAPNWLASLEGGPNDYWRAQAGFDNLSDNTGFNFGIIADHDGGYRDDSHYDQAKAFTKLKQGFDSGELLLGFSGSWLDQDTAGFIQGEDAYRDEDIRFSNPNPEAYRKANSQRLSGRWTPTNDSGPWQTQYTGVLRRSDMEFLQHFLPGDPLEENGQVSVAFLASGTRDAWRDSILTLGFDTEVADGWLKQTQATDAAPPNRPQGKHYDYDVTSIMAAPYAQIDLPLASKWNLQAGLRAEYLRYDYDNNMQSGNLDDNDQPCGVPEGCLYYRPESRTDDFFNVAPNIGVLYRINESLSAFANLARGFRVPQATELYRLQANQEVSDIDSTTIDSFEVGVRRQSEALQVELVAFVMEKDNDIFRDADGFNVSDGKTEHWGVETQIDWRPWEPIYFSFTGSYAEHTYDFDRNLSFGESITSGDDVDTAPQVLASARLGYEHRLGRAEAEWTHMDEYFLNASNTAKYDGHDLLNLRLILTPVDDWQLGIRVNNVTDEYYADRADFAFGNYRYFPGREREVYVELAYRKQ
ncbi:MAG: TonB-dependent receptor [Gammaproteobacteria bacterium]